MLSLTQSVSYTAVTLTQQIPSVTHLHTQGLACTFISECAHSLTLSLPVPTLCQSVISHTICVTHSSHSSSVWLTLSHTQSLCHTQSPRAAHTAFSRHLWVDHIHSVSHIMCPCDSYRAHALTTLHTLSHNLSLSHMVSRCHSPPNSVSGTPTSWYHTVTYMLPLSSHTQPVGMTRFRTVTLCYTASHEVTQPHTTSGITHNFTVLHTHTISLCHTHTPSFGVTPGHPQSFLHSAHTTFCPL